MRYNAVLRSLALAARFSFAGMITTFTRPYTADRCKTKKLCSFCSRRTNK